MTKDEADAWRSLLEHGAELACHGTAELLSAIHGLAEFDVAASGRLAAVLADTRNHPGAALLAGTYLWLAGDRTAEGYLQLALEQGIPGAPEMMAEYLVEELRWEDALRLCRSHGLTGYLTGTVLLAVDQPAAAAGELEAAVARGDLRNGDTHYNLAIARGRCGTPDPASLATAFAHGCQKAGVELFVAGQLPDASQLKLDELGGADCCRLAHHLIARGRLDEAAEACRRSASSRLAGDLHAARGDHGQARREYVIGARRGDASCLAALAERANLTLRPRIARLLLRAATRTPELGRRYESAHLMALNYDPSVTPQHHYSCHEEWGRGVSVATGDRRQISGRIRLGFVSPDLGCHPVGYFLLPLLRGLDRSRFETVLLSCTTRHEWAQDELRSLADVWIDADGMSTGSIIEAVKRSRVDILVDTSGHSAGNLLASVFAARPAPLQVSWAGYVGTTGLAAIDAVIMDRQQLPADTPLVEGRLDLPGPYVCWAPYPYTPEVGPGPGLPGVVFGSFNNLYKLNRPTISLWSRLLTRVPDARLVIRSHGGALPHVAGAIRSCFRSNGISDERVTIGGGLGHVALLEAYGEVDICLDCAPYSGGLTTIEALWQGVPVLTLAGERFCSRHSQAHLWHAGLRELICCSADEFVSRGAELSADRPRLAALRRALRPLLAAGPLLDQHAFAQGFSAALLGLAAERGLYSDH